MAAIACAPPTLKICVIPALRAAANNAGSAVPLAEGGVHMMRTGHSAMAAGTANINAVDGNGAEAAGTYRPTARIGTLKRSHSTPRAVFTRIGGAAWAA